ncbi:MAG TPA: nucleotidyltransferase domain-containing protein [Anaerolineales bacterium]|nr:nucleotidyltransferase domain-containing protein [Anaerolineales bacterium]
MTSTKLQDNEQLALQGLIETLQNRFSEQLRDVILYGSKARGDSTPDSDIDILIILSDENEQLRRDILTIASQFSLEYDVLISPHVIGETRFSQKRGFTYYRNVARDAIQLNITRGKLTLSPGTPVS